MPDIDLAVTMQSRHPHPTVWLELTYDGIQPPVELFGDLEMIGWKPPAPASPPATAIDWSSPDPVTGEEFTINSWTVEKAIIRPPEGSGFRGHWAPGEATAFLRSVEGVLTRHQLLGGAPAAVPTEAAEPEVSASPSPARANLVAPAVDLTLLPEPPAAPREPTPLVSSPFTAGTSVLRAEIGPLTSRDGIVSALNPLGVAAHFGTATKIVQETYRASTYEREVTVSVVEVLVDDSLAEVASTVLRDLGLVAELHAAPNEGATAAAPATQHTDA